MAVKETFANSEIGNAFEKGLCSNEAFIHVFRQAFSLEGTDAELTALWNSWVQAPYPGIIEAITALQENYQVACLSNTNDLHWEHLKSYVDLKALFSPAYASHEIHLAKPDTDCFEFVSSDLGIAPEKILFFDDTQANIDTAKACGWQALKIDPEYGAMPALKTLGLI